MHHSCCSPEVPAALRGLAPAAAWADVAPGQDTSHGQWFGPWGIPKAGNTGVWAGPTVVGGQHHLCSMRLTPLAPASSPKDSTVGLLLFLPIDHAGEQPKRLGTWG